MSSHGQGFRITLKICCRGIVNQRFTSALMAFAVALLGCLAHTADAMTIYVLDPTYTSLTLDVEPSDTVENVKAKVQDIGGPVPSSQYLYLSNTLLEDGRTLSDYNIPLTCPHE